MRSIDDVYVDLPFVADEIREVLINVMKTIVETLEHANKVQHCGDKDIKLKSIDAHWYFAEMTAALTQIKDRFKSFSLSHDVHA